MVEAKSDTGHFLYLKLYLEVFWKVLETQPMSSNITWGKEKILALKSVPFSFSFTHFIKSNWALVNSSSTIKMFAEM